MINFGPFGQTATAPIMLSWKAPCGKPFPPVPAWPDTTLHIECCGEPHRLVMGSDGTLSTPDHREEHDVLWAIADRPEQPVCYRAKNRLLFHYEDFARLLTNYGIQGHSLANFEGFHGTGLAKLAQDIAHIRLANLRFRHREVPEVSMSDAGRQAMRQATDHATAIGCVAIAMSSHTCEWALSKLQTVVMLADPNGNCTGRAALHDPPGTTSPAGPIVSHFATGSDPNRVLTDSGDFAKAAFMVRPGGSISFAELHVHRLISQALIGDLLSLAYLAELWGATYDESSHSALARFNEQRRQCPAPPTEAP